MKKVFEADITCAADLLKSLNALADTGQDLSVVYVQNGQGDAFANMEVYEVRLTDGSTVHDMRFKL